MLALFPVLAEIADKEPAFRSIWIIAVLVTITCSIITYGHRWGFFPAAILAFIFADLTFAWYAEPNVLPDVLELLGMVYVSNRYLAACVPAIGIVFTLLMRGCLRRMAQPLGAANGG